jgi:Xaa-Pro aminopeptidase
LLASRLRVSEGMKRHGVDAVIAASPVSVTYLSAYVCWVDPILREYMVVPGGGDHLTMGTYALMTSDGSVSLIVNALFAVNAAELDIESMYVFGASASEFDDRGTGEELRAREYLRVHEQLRAADDGAGAIQALVHALQDQGVDRGRIGVELSAMAPQARAELSGALPRAQLRECTNLLRLARAVKSDRELERLTRAAEINERATTECLDLALPGALTRDLVDHYRRRVADMGALIDHLAFGLAGLGIATEVNHRLAAGETMYVDFGCIYSHYYSDSGRTLAVGEHDPHLTPTYDALLSCVQEGAKTLRPGVHASSVHAEMRRTLDEAGVSRSNPHGHGLGLEVREYPLIMADAGNRIVDDCIDVPADLTLEAGMVVNLESAYFIPARASLHVEMSFVLTEHGSRPLTGQNRSAPYLSTTS